MGTIREAVVPTPDSPGGAVRARQPCAPYGMRLIDGVGLATGLSQRYALTRCFPRPSVAATVVRVPKAARA